MELPYEMDKSLLDKSKLVVTSTWNTEYPDKHIQNSVSLSVLNESVSIEDIVSLDSCVHLLCPEGDDTIGCTLYIKFSEPSLFSVCRVVVVSEARMVEVYGDCGEYCTTCKGDYIDEFEGCAVYKADASLQLPTQEVLLKFAGLKDKHQMWIYGICLLVKQTDKVQGIANVNFQKVNELLKESKIPLSDKAEKCKKFLQSYGGFTDSKMQGKAPDPQILIKLLESQCMTQLKPLSETGRKCLSNLMPFLSKEEKDLHSCENKVPVTDSCSGSSHDLKELKQYVDLRIAQLEHSLYTKLDNMLNQIEIKQNEKLDTILRTLKKSSI